MKKSLKSISVLVVSISVLAMLLLGSTATAQTHTSFVYDKKENTETVFTLDPTGKYLTPKLKYEFANNENGSITEKRAYCWNIHKADWQPHYLMKFTKENSNTLIEYASWDETTDTFSKNKQKTVYNLTAENELKFYHSYLWNDETSDWNLCQQLLLQDYLAIHID